MRLAAAALAAVLAGCGGGEAAQSPWKQEPSLRHGRSAHAVVSDGRTVYAVGGTGVEGQPVLQVERFDGEEWTAETTLPGEGLNAPAAALVGARLYVIGGFQTTTNVATDRVRVYDTESEEWSEAAPLPTPRGGHAAVVFDGRIHVFGGGDSVSTLDHHSVYDPETDAWRDETPLPTAKGSPAAVVHDGRIWVIGGRSGSDDYGDVDVYDPAARTWRRGPAIPPRGTHGAAVLDGEIHVFGGESQARGTALAGVLRLQDGAWRQVATMPVARGYARAVTVGDDVLVVGGTREPGSSHASSGSDRVDRYSAR